jgi:acyl carrier protein
MSAEQNVLRRDDLHLLQEFRPPASTTEMAVARMWCTAIGIDRIGVHDSYFDVGGTSFAAAVIFVEIEQTFGLKLPMSILVDVPTVATLSERIDRLLAGRRA